MQQISEFTRPCGRGRLVLFLCQALLGLVFGLGADPSPAYARRPVVVDGPATLPPLGWLGYCRRHPVDPSCNGMAAPSEAPADGEGMLEEVQRAIGTLPRRREAAGAPDTWEIAGARGGDCEDLALAARKLLIERGFPATALRIALGRTETGEGHAVLTVDMEDGGRPVTYVLDNRYRHVIRFDRFAATGFRILARQAPTGIGWVVAS